MTWWIQIISEAGEVLTEEGPYLHRDFAEMQQPEVERNMRLFYDDIHAITRIVEVP